MKKSYAMRHILLAGLMAVGSIAAFAVNDRKTDPEHYFLTVEEVPSSIAILMCPPDTTSARFAYDREQYEWGKTMRNTPRGRQAITTPTSTGIPTGQTMPLVKRSELRSQRKIIRNFIS